MRAKKWKLSNSLGPHIPQPPAAGLHPGEKAVVAARPLLGTRGDWPLPGPGRPLRTLLSRVTSRNRHEAAPEGGPIGHEAW